MTSLFTITKCAIIDMNFEKLNAKDICRHLFKRASELLMKYNKLNPVVFLLTTDTCYILDVSSFMRDTNSKEMLIFLLKRMIKDIPLIGIAFAMECWIRDATKEEIHTQPVAAYPDKREAIIVQCEWHDATQFMITAEFTTELNDANQSFIKISEVKETQWFEGRFSNILALSYKNTMYN